jgi:Tol biopolymer transport system component
MITRPTPARRLKDRFVVLVLATSVMCTFGVGPAAAYAAPGHTSRASVAGGGLEANGRSELPAISADGRFVAFESEATNLVPGDVNQAVDVFVHDRETGETALVSMSSEGTQANADSSDASISADGRFVAFASWASNLVPADTNVRRDVFVHDVWTGRTDRVSIASSGAQGDGNSDEPTISPDGSAVVFDSEASNFAAADINGFVDVYLHDRSSHTTELVGVRSDGGGPVNATIGGSLSWDGRYVAFSTAEALAPGDVNNTYDAYLRDRETGVLEQVSVASDGTPGDFRSSASGISANGQLVVFTSASSNLTPGDRGTSLQQMDVFVRDRLAAVTEMVSVASSGAPANEMSYDAAISPDGRFVAFSSSATNLGIPDHPYSKELFVHDRFLGLTARPSFGFNGQPPSFDASHPSLASGAAAVAFHSSAQNLVKKDWNFATDVFVREMGPPVGVGALEASTRGPGTIDVAGWARFAGTEIASATDASTDGLLPPFAGAELEGAHLIARPEEGDVLVRLELESLPSKLVMPDDPDGVGVDFDTPPSVQEIVYGLDVTAAGVSYEIRASLAQPDPGWVLVPSFALYACQPVCQRVSALEGNIGESGEEVRVAVPVAALGLTGGAAMSGLRAWTAVGFQEASIPGPPVDELAIPGATFPAPRLELGFAPTGTPGSQVPFEPTSMQNGDFSTTLEVSSLADGEQTVWARACLGSECGWRHTEVRL